MALQPATKEQQQEAPPLEAPVISIVPVSADEIAEIGSALSALGSEITGHNGLVVMPMVSSYNWNLSYDFNVNWRTAGGHPATGHLPSCATRDIQTTWTPPA